MENLKLPVWILTGAIFVMAVVLRREKETPLILGITTVVIMAWSVLCGLMAYFSWRDLGQVNIQWTMFFLASAVMIKVSFDRFQRLQQATDESPGTGP